MGIVTGIIIQIATTGLNIVSARFQAWWFDKKQKKISHFWWAVGYGLYVVAVYWFTRNWFLAAAVLVQRIPVFNSLLNYFRTPRRAIFYINPKGDSWQDRFYGKLYPLVFWISIALLITLQFFIW